jgi:hypothetical protein
VRSFLRNLGLKVNAFQVRSERNEPPDVRYFRAAFEVKEVMDKGRRRHDEYRDFARRADAATDPNELVEMYDPIDVTLEELVEHARVVAHEFTSRYSDSTRGALDLLVYINLLHVQGIEDGPAPGIDALRATGFRSISFLKGSQTSYVAYATHKAPSFLRDRVGKLFHWDHAT